MQAWMTEVVLVIVGFVLLAKGADWLVDGGAALARRMGVRPLMIGLTVVAWGTSLPEVVVSGLAAWQGRPGASLGNVLGSNVANIGLVLGTSALILPAILKGRTQPREAFWLLLSIGTLWAVCSDKNVTRWEAGILLTIFATYNLLLYRSSRRISAKMAEDELDEQVQTEGRPVMWIIIGSISIGIGAKLVMLGA
ncbi:MAG: cation:H+ antiporter, partial [Planctomycetota bacterium]